MSEGSFVRTAALQLNGLLLLFPLPDPASKLLKFPPQNPDLHPMASSSLLHSLPLRRPSAGTCRHSAPSPPMFRRRSLSLLLLSSPAISALSFAPPSSAEDIPLFGLRKKLRKVEEEAEELVREGEEVIGKAAEEQIAGGVGLGLGLGDLVQAGAVAGAEAVGVLVGVSVVNGILGPEGKKL